MREGRAEGGQRTSPVCAVRGFTANLRKLAAGEKALSRRERWGEDRLWRKEHVRADARAQKCVKPRAGGEKEARSGARRERRNEVCRKRSTVDGMESRHGDGDGSWGKWRNQ